MLKRLYNKMFKNSATVAEPSETGITNAKRFPVYPYDKQMLRTQILFPGSN